MRKGKTKRKHGTKKSTSTATHTPTGSQHNQTAIRKRAQRVKQVLPDNSRAWASTMKHLIENATPKRQKLLLSNAIASEEKSYANISEEKSNTITSEEKTLRETLNINKPGRPNKVTEKIKKRLAYTDSSK